MDCPKCGASNAPLKKTCYNCGAVLNGWTVNNATGEFGFRAPDGSFTKDPKVSKAILDARQTLDDFDKTMQANIPTLPKAVEDFINEYIEKIKAETTRQYGDSEMATIALPAYRQMMRIGAFAALAIKDE